MRKICIITGTRAEWGLLSPIAAALRSRPDTELQLVVTNMHLDPAYGHTVDGIEAEGFSIDARVAMPPAGDSPEVTVKAMSVCMVGMAGAFGRLSPDLVVILGDRTEMLAVAAAASVMRIPIAHLHGGEVSEGAVDDSIRHAITKLASLHLTSTDDYRRRVIQMGEVPGMVLNTGAIGVWNTLNVPDVPDDELIGRIGFLPDRSTVMVTYHPATADDDAAPSERFAQLLMALDSHIDAGGKVVMSYPNNDARGGDLIGMIRRWADMHPDSVCAVPSLGMKSYLATVRRCGAVVGNSSSGIIEVPSLGVPTLDIGMRQRGRSAAASVIHCGDSAGEISRALAEVLSPEAQAKARAVSNPYYRPDTLRLIVDALCDTPLEALRHKHFHDIPFTAI